MRLYELAGQHLRLQEQIDAGEDVTEALSALDGALSEKGAGIVAVLANLRADADAIDAEIKRLSARKKAADAAGERLREYVRGCMQAAEVHRIAGPTFTITLGEGPERVVVDDEALVPEAYLRVRCEVNKSQILEAYKTDGEVVPGTRIERGTRLTIR